MHVVALSQSDKTALQAYIAVLTLQPQLNDEPYADPVLEDVLCLMGVNFSDYWTPNADFFNRLNKSQLSEIAKNEVSDEFAQQHASSKKVVFAEALSRSFNIDQGDSTSEKGKTWIPDCLSTVRN